MNQIEAFNYFYFGARITGCKALFTPNWQVVAMCVFGGGGDVKVL